MPATARLSPNPAPLTAKAVALRLAQRAVYPGLTGECFYSLAQHCCVVAAEMLKVCGFNQGPRAALYALLHHAEDALDGELSGYTRYQQRAEMLANFGLHDFNPLPGDDHMAMFAAMHERAELSERSQFDIGPADHIARAHAKGIRSLQSVIRPLNWDRAADKFVSDLNAYAIAARNAR